jgi:hypothetical protein
MGLSEHEQKLLEEMERALYAEDPRFASSLKDTAPRSVRTARNGLMALVIMAGIAAIAVGIGSQIALLGVLGFVAVLLGLYAIVTAAISQTGQPQAPRGQRGPGLMNKAEERFKNRRDGFDQPDQP